MAASHPHAHDPAHDDHHADHHAHGGVGKYVVVFVLLCLLTLVSFAVGNSQTLRENSPGASCT